MSSQSLNGAASPLSDTIQGIGIGLRSQHYQYILNNKPSTPWFEVLTDNYMGDGGQPLDYLEKIRVNYPVTFHGVGMSLGSAGPLNMDYMRRLKSLMDRFEPAWVSDHACWNASGKHYSHDLLPLPYTDEAVRLLANKILQVQDFLGEQIIIENVSSYVEFSHSSKTEWQFLNAVIEEADCGLLFDVNNIYVNTINHNQNAEEFIENINSNRIKEIHLAGYEDHGSHLLDTHGYPVHDPVWTLYRLAIESFGNIPTLIEWDTDIPDFRILEEEARKAEIIQTCVQDVRAA
ncbi:MAG: DUF692 domain-containing protein [Gammaproteobacteria bacterium]|nr:MAG: DUF692 domain-containing protein [Gammaproteobacteria bacterium]